MGILPEIFDKPITDDTGLRADTYLPAGPKEWAKLKKLKKSRRKTRKAESRLWLKFNPNHDAKGKFSSGKGGAAVVDAPRRASSGVEKIEFDDGFKLYALRNPSADDAKAKLKNSKHGELRGLVESSTRNVWVWEAEKANHDQVADKLGLDWYGDIIANNGRLHFKNEGSIDIVFERMAKNENKSVADDLELKQLLLKFNQPRVPAGSPAGGQFTSAKYSAGEIMAKIKASPQFAARQSAEHDEHWDKYAARWGVSGQEFHSVEVDTDTLLSLTDRGSLGISRHRSEEEITKKRAGESPINPTIIARPPNERAPVFVLDGTHSMIAQIQNHQTATRKQRDKYSKTHVIISTEAAAIMGIPIPDTAKK